MTGPASEEPLSEDFRAVYQAHLPTVWRYVRARVPDTAEAEDVTSETFLRALRAWDRYDESRGSVPAWLTGIARHTVADWWRGRDPEVALPQPDPGADERRGPEASAVLGDEVAQLRRHVAGLSEREQDALALRFAAGLRTAEVGALLGCSEAAAKMLVHRAITKLRAVMPGE